MGGERRQVGRLLRQRLPHDLLEIARTAGGLADRTGQALFLVGGCVRDLLLGQPLLDLDLLLEGDAVAFAPKLARELGAHCKTDKRFGTAALRLPNRRLVHLATARTEFYECPGALPKVEPSTVEQDLRRRDFTINAMAIQLNSDRFGRLLDQFGGQRDLTEGVIRVLHDLSLVDDPTRLIRSVRFEQRYRFHMDEQTEALERQAIGSGLLGRVSDARVRDELIPVLSEQRPLPVLRRMRNLGLLTAIHPSLTLDRVIGARLEQTRRLLSWSATHAAEAKVEPWIAYFLALTSEMEPRELPSLARRLRLGRRAVLAPHASLDARESVLPRLASRKRMRPSEIYRALCHLPAEVVLYLAAITDSASARERLRAFISELRHRRPSISGADLIALGYRPGPAFGEAMEAVHDALLDGKVHTREQQLSLARRFLDWAEG